MEKCFENIPLMVYDKEEEDKEDRQKRQTKKDR